MTPLRLLPLLSLPFLAGCSDAAVDAAPTATPSQPVTEAAAGTPPPAAPASDVIEEPEPPVVVEAAELTDDPLEAYRSELLTLAFDGASRMPLVPHVKNRSRAQQKVILARLELGQRATALAEVHRVENWRRGLCLAALAVRCAEDGHDPSSVQPFIDGALRVASGREEALGQAWRRDRILATVGSAYARLGDRDKAEAMGLGISSDSESGKVGLALAEDGDEELCDGFIASYDAVLELGTLDQIRAAVATATRFYDRFYDDEVRRGLLEGHIRRSVKRIPRDVGVDVMRELAVVTYGHGDAERAAEALDVAQGLVDGATWRTEDQIKLMARLAESRAALGDTAAGRAQAEAGLELFRNEGETIADMWRGAPLRELAEAYVALGDRPAALEVYRTAVEEGARNPNARPRVDDLVATCVSMAVEGIEPDEALWARIREVHDGLEAPW